MYNLLLALAAAVVAFALGFAVSGWIAGFIPAMIAFVGAYFVLARRSGRQLEAIVSGVQVPMQKGDLEAVRALLKTALPLGKWQFLVEPQIHAQLGQVDYLDGVKQKLMRNTVGATERFASARASLEIAKTLTWQAAAFLSVIHHREGRSEEAIKVLAVVADPKKGGSGIARALATVTPKPDPIFWGLYAWLLNEAKKRDEALQVLGTGLEANPKQKGLVAMQEALSNRRRPDMSVFGETWYMFFPEQVPQEKVMEMQKAQMANRSPKTWPQPRR